MTKDVRKERRREFDVTILADVWRKMSTGDIINSIVVAVLVLKSEHAKLNESQKEQLLSLIREIIDLILQK